MLASNPVWKQDTAKEFTKYCCNELFSHVRLELQQVSNEKIEPEHQLAIEEKDHQHQLAIANIDRQHQKVIEEKDDEIQNLVRNRHVPRSGNIDNILCVVEKIIQMKQENLAAIPIT